MGTREWQMYYIVPLREVLHCGVTYVILSARENRKAQDNEKTTRHDGE